MELDQFGQEGLTSDILENNVIKSTTLIKRIYEWSICHIVSGNRLGISMKKTIDRFAISEKEIGWHFNEKDNHEATISESDNHKKDSNLETYEEVVKKMLKQHENWLCSRQFWN